MRVLLSPYESYGDAGLLAGRWSRPGEPLTARDCERSGR